MYILEIMLDDITIDDRVQNGVKWLECNAPWWRENVSVENLDMSSPLRCILGQVFYSPGDTSDYNGYSRTVDYVFVRAGINPATLGFCGGRTTPPNLCRAEMRMLRNAWEQEIWRKP